jgi:hypothetical protein
MYKPSLEKIGPVEYRFSALLEDSREGGLSFTKNNRILLPEPAQEVFPLPIKA